MKRAGLVVLTVFGCLGCNGVAGSSASGSSATAPGSTQSPSGVSAPSSTSTTTSPTSSSTSTSTSTSGLPQIFPANNPWNQDISNLPVHANSANFINSIGATIGLHPDFGSSPDSGIPYCVVDGTKQPLVPINPQAASESDPGPYPVPANAPIEGGASSTGDRHVLVIDRTGNKLYEMFSSTYNATTGGWDCGSSAIFDLTSNNLRPIYWTSADAAGLPIFPGLVRYEEAVTQGAINHALRFTCVRTQRGFISPARHWASSSTDPNLPPMGLRLRLKASTNISGFPPEVQVILTALKKYGMIVADNGSNWYISGAPNPGWNDSTLHQINGIHGSDFEAVDTGPITTK